MSADNVVFVVKTKKRGKASFGVFHGSASWFEELWLDVSSLREPELRFYKSPEPGRLAELLAEGEQFTSLYDALVRAGEMAVAIPYVEYGIQIVDVTGKHEPWTKDVADQPLRNYERLEALRAAVLAALEGKEGEVVFRNPGFPDGTLRDMYVAIRCEVGDRGRECQWCPGDGDEPESYRLTPVPAE
ncbi:MAG: hypothetical protein IPM23_03320 [Candidatus Melainabacteria bacterium]|nr:hypothetical protein [Candidatus Melainabacteria bacterium]